MIRTGVRCIVLLFFAALPPLLSAETYPTDAEIREILVDRIDRARQSVGIVVGVVNGDGRTVVGYGRSHLDVETVPDEHTVFEIGSVSKLFTGVLLADLVQSGKVSEQDTVQRFLPKTVHLQHLEGVPPMTLYDLATHTSGLPSVPDNGPPADFYNQWADYDSALLYEFLNNYKPEPTPDEKATYSNLGMGLLGHVLALHMGVSYEQMVHEHITGPLGMPSTAIELSPELEQRLARGHDQYLMPVSHWEMSVLAGAGGLRSTVNDLLSFAEANLGLRQSELLPVLLDAQQPREPIFTAGQVGYGWVTRPLQTRVIRFHAGWSGGQRSFIGLDTERKRGVVVLSNATFNVEDIGLHLLDPQHPLRDLQPLEIFSDIPQSPTGEALRTWWKVVSQSDDETIRTHFVTHFGESMHDSLSFDAYLKVSSKIAQRLQGFRVEKAAFVADFSLAVLVQLPDGSWERINIVVEPEPPHRILGLMVKQLPE